MEWWLDLLAFAARVALITVGFAVCVAAVASALRRGSGGGGGERPSVTLLNEEVQLDTDALRRGPASRKERRALRAQRRAAREALDERPSLFVIDFRGDITASAVDGFRHLVTALLHGVRDGDRVLIRLESAGGQVHSYGLAAAQLDRLRRAGVSLTVCVDRVAASGGYMMACVGEQIVAAPFAIIGSIGVVAEMPNVNRLLREHGVDWVELTAGEFKRTITPMGEITEARTERVLEQLRATHRLFQDHIEARRPQLDVARVATGEYWYGAEAMGLGLVDEIATSDDVIVRHLDTHRVVEVQASEPDSWRDRLPFVSARRRQHRAALPPGM